MERLVDSVFLRVNESRCLLLSDRVHGHTSGQQSRETRAGHGADGCATAVRSGAAVAANRSNLPTCPGPTVAFGKQDSFRQRIRAREPPDGVTTWIRASRSPGRGTCGCLRPGVGSRRVRPTRDAIAGRNRAAIRSAVDADQRHARAVRYLSRAWGNCPGEYCEGLFSLHLSGGPKVAGIAQRVIRGASLTTAVIAVGAQPTRWSHHHSLRSTLTWSSSSRCLDGWRDHAGKPPSITASEVADMLAKLAWPNWAPVTIYTESSSAYDGDRRYRRPRSFRPSTMTVRVVRTFGSASATATDPVDDAFEGAPGRARGRARAHQDHRRACRTRSPRAARSRQYRLRQPGFRERTAAR